MKLVRRLLNILREDAAFAYRSLARVPTYAATAILSFAIGIGGVTAIFSVLYAVVLRPLPFPDSDEIVVVHGNFTAKAMERMPMSPGEFRDVKTKSGSFAAATVYNSGSANATGRGEPLHVAAAWVSADFFRVFGTPPAAGRDFAPDEDRPGAQPVAIITSAFQRRMFSAATDAVGQHIALDGVPHTIIGVLPPVYDHEPRVGEMTGEDAEPRDVWVPLQFAPEQFEPRSRGNRAFAVIARLKHGASLKSAQADIAKLGESFFDAYPTIYNRETGWRMTVESLQAYGTLRARVTLLVLSAAVALVLVVACANVVSLALARLVARRREIAVRVALGASTQRVVAQFLVESALLAFVGGVVGIGIAHISVTALLDAAADSPVVRRIQVSFQWPVLAFALGVSLLSGILSGVVPAWHAARFPPLTGLREGGRATVGNAARLRSALVVGQVTLALVLLVGTTLLLQSVMALTATSPGFDVKDVYVASVAMASNQYGTPAAKRRFVANSVDKLHAIPGVEAVAFTNMLPMSGWHEWMFGIEGAPPSPVPASAQTRMVAGDYVGTLGLHLAAGRPLTPGDTHDTPDVGVVSESFVAKYFPARNPLGQRLLIGGPKDRRAISIVGIVKDTKDMGIDEPIRPTLYVPFDQWPSDSGSFAVRSSRHGPNVLESMRTAIAAIDSNQPLYALTPLQRMADESLGPRRFTSILLGIFSGIGLALAALGVYGITSYLVVQRSQEFAVRMALGADDIAIMRLVLTQAVRLVAAGLIFGVVIARLLGNVMASAIYGLSPWDAKTVLMTSALLFVTGVLAGWVPARRATALPLSDALRTE